MHEKQNHPHPRIRLRMEVLHLENLGKSHKEISEITGVSNSAIRSYFDQYEEGGIKKLAKTGHKVICVNTKNRYLKSLKEKPVLSVKECCTRIEELCGIKRRMVQVWNFMQKIGLDYCRITAISKKTVSEKKGTKRVCEHQTQRVRLKKAEDGTRRVLFVDAAHFVMGAFFSCE